MMVRELETVGAVIDVIGATTLARITNRKSQHVSNWRRENKFPASTFLIITSELSERGMSAPPSLFGMEQPEQAAS